MANSPSPTVEELQLRKRARRRLIGAVTLVAVMVTVLPMVLDDEPKPVGQDIAINIPSQQSPDFPLKAAAPSTPVQESPPQQEKAAEAPPPKPPEVRPEPPKVQPKATPEPPKTQPKAAPEPPVAAAKVAEGHAGGYVILLGAFLSEANTKQRQTRLKELGVRYYEEKIKSPAGEKTGVRAGPYPTREEAERILARLKAGGIQDGLVSEKK